MSILEENTILTEEQKIANQVGQIKMASMQAFGALKNSFESLFISIWKDTNFTPQQILTGYGTDAATLFAVAGKTIELLMLIDPTYTPPMPPNAYTINQDGTVTVNA